MAFLFPFLRGSNSAEKIYGIDGWTDRRIDGLTDNKKRAALESDPFFMLDPASYPF